MSALKPPRPWPRDKNGKPKRRVAVPGNTGVYWRADGTFEVGYRDADGRQRWRGPFDTLTEARAARGDARAWARGGERESANPRLKFGEAADRWLAEQVVELRPTTGAIYGNAIRNHLAPRWGDRRMDAIDVTDAARLVRELRAQGLSEWTIAGILKAAGRVFKFARRHCRWRGENPVGLLEGGERPKVSASPERRIYTGEELVQTLAASTEPWTTVFRLAGVVAGRQSELLGLWWENLDEHKARTRAPTGPRLYVFGTRTGRPVNQREVLRALHRAQERARDADGRPTFPELFEHDERGHLVVDDDGGYVLRDVPRKELPPLPDFDALRHTAAMDCDDAEEARDLLRHSNSNVTRAIYRAHFDDRRRANLRARMEARMEATERAKSAATPAEGWRGSR
jgi:integrase